MTTSCKQWWRNCALEADSEILEIDRIEDQISPLFPTATKIRELISSLELCHHKSERWIFNIIEAIGAGKTTKGLGSRLPGESHATELVWQNACAALTAWCAGCPSETIDYTIDAVPASQLLSSIGNRSTLKEWQVQRVIDKIRSNINWPLSLNDPAAQYVWLLLNDGEYDVVYRDECPDRYREHEDFWQETVRTIIHDTHNGEKAELSLGLAIDMLMPCHWGFATNLGIVLDAIGGILNPETPFAACGRNISLLPNGSRMDSVCDTLKAFCNSEESNGEIDKELLELLGKQTKLKRWLVASLEKTIRLQLYPPADLRDMCNLAGPDWIRE